MFLSFGCFSSIKVLSIHHQAVFVRISSRKVSLSFCTYNEMIVKFVFLSINCFKHKSFLGYQRQHKRFFKDQWSLLKLTLCTQGEIKTIAFSAKVKTQFSRSTIFVCECSHWTLIRKGDSKCSLDSCGSTVFNAGLWLPMFNYKFIYEWLKTSHFPRNFFLLYI